MALRADGSAAARADAGYPTIRPQAGRAEQAPKDWIAALRAVITKLTAEVPPRHWAAIGLSGMIPTLVPLGPEAEPLGRAIIWEDCRAEEQAGRLRNAIGEEELYARTGQWVDGRYLLPFAMWLH
jgi:sugar (pentulose or hexulose) kinase